VIVKENGSRCWAGRGESTYSNTEHFLLCIDEGSVVCSCEGRLSKEKKEEWIEIALNDKRNVKA
jgi:hypothetical protein